MWQNPLPWQKHCQLCFIGLYLLSVTKSSIFTLLLLTEIHQSCRTSFFPCPQFVIWKWLDFLLRCCTSFFASPQFVIWKWLDFWCVAALRFRLSTVCHLKMTRFFAALLHFVFPFTTICHLKMTRFFGSLLHFGFACPQFIIWKWLDFLVRCCTTVSLVHSLSFEND